jgi:hypothetical protein
LQTVSWEIFPILNKVFLTLTLGQHPLKIWVFVASITEFIFGLDILRTYDASVDLEHQMLHLAEQEVSLWSPRAGPLPSGLVWKKNGDLCFCMDYRKLNDVTKKNCFPLPRIDNTLDTLAGAKWFSTWT